MYDVRGKSVNGKGRMQQAVEEWEKSAKDAAAPHEKEDSGDFDAEVKNIIKSNMRGNNSGKAPEPETQDEEVKTAASFPVDEQDDDGNIEADAQQTSEQQDTMMGDAVDDDVRTDEILSDEPVDGQEDESVDEDDEPVDEDDEVHDYEKVEQAEDIISDQESLRSSLALRFAGCTACTIILVLLALAPVFKIQLPHFINAADNPSNYIVANLILLLLAGAIGFSVAFKGIANLFTFKQDADSLTSLSFYAAIIGGIYMLYRYTVSATIPADLPAAAIFTSCAAVCLSFNLLGKVFLVSRVKNNLEFISSPSNIKSGFYSAVPVEAQKAHGIMRTFNGTPTVVTAQKTGFLTNFLEQSYASTPSDNAARLLAPIALVAALATAAGELIIKKDASGAVIAFCAVCCAASPVMFEVGVAVPFYRSCRHLLKRQALVAGCETLSEFGGTDAAVAEGNLVFPQSSIHVYGIKPFSGYDIEEVMLYAASIACAGESPLSGAFMAMFADAGSGKKMLKDAEKVVYEDEKGLSAIVDGKVVLLGNRGLLRHHIIDAPSRDFELRYAVNGRDVVYLAIDGVICAIFILGYSVDEKTASAFRKLRRYGVKVLIKSSDSNISPQLIEEKSGVPADGIAMLGAREMQILEGEENSGRCRAGLAFKDLKGFASAIVSCIKLKGSLRANSILQAVFSVAGMLLVVYAAFFAKGGALIAPVYLLAYQAICAVPVLLISLFRQN